MIKATGKGPNGRDTLFVGLSHGNLNKFLVAPLETYILIDGKEIGLSHDVMIFSGKTEADMADVLAPGFGPDTKVIVSSRSKN